MTGVIEQGHEPGFQVEVAGRVVGRVDFDSPDADLLGQEFDSPQRIHQEEGAQPAALDAPVHRQAPEEHDRDIDPR